MAVIWPPYVSKIDPLNDTKTDPLPGAGACGSCGRGGPGLGCEEPRPRSLWAALRGWTSKLRRPQLRQLPQAFDAGPTQGEGVRVRRSRCAARVLALRPGADDRR